MLIVVAIIAILIAISIPIINNALEKARDATDDANFRSAAALANIKLLTEESPAGTYYYKTDSSAQGVLTANKSDDAAGTGTPARKLYESQCTSSTAHGKTGTSSGKVIEAKIDADGTITVAWVDKS